MPLLLAKLSFALSGHRLFLALRAAPEIMTGSVTRSWRNGRRARFRF
jgi:hypothetical protein